MSAYERTDQVLNRAARGEADIAEIENCIAATRADLDRNLSAIEQRLSTDELINQAVDYLRSGPTEFLSNFGRSVKENPVPAALMAVGIGWMMFGGRRSAGNGHVAAPYRGGGWADEEDDDFAAQGRDDEGLLKRSGETVRNVADTARERAADLGDRLSGRVSGLTDRASLGTASLGRRVSHTVDQIGGKMSDASKHAQQVFQTARERIAEARETLSRQPKRLQAGYQDLAENHPFVLGALAFVAGAALAASLRRTQLEDEMVGQYRDQALDEAERRARYELQRGASAARTALTSDEEASDRMETTPDDSRQDSESQSSPHASGERESPDRIH